MVNWRLSTKNLGGHQITWKGFVKLAKKEKQIQVCEIGCGGGDNMKTIEQKREINMAKFISPELISIQIVFRLPEETGWKNPAKFLVSDLQESSFPDKT